MKKELSSRMRRFEEKRLRTRLLLISLGSGGLLLLLGIFGVRLLIGLSIFMDNVRGSDSPQQQKRAMVIAPYVDPLPLATSSGKLVITGRGQKEATVILYINDKESKKTKIAEDGTFILSSISLGEGDYTIQAKTQDSAGKLSDFSNTVRTTIKRRPPILELNKPLEGEKHTGGDNLYPIEGKTEEDVDIRINDRFVVVRQDGTFSYPYPLNEGENNLIIKAIDRAGNNTQLTRTITYQK